MKRYTRLSETQVNGESMAWFPRRIADLDVFASRVLEADGELKSDHPGFKDAEYRARRKHIAKVALEFKHGDTLPHIEYTPAEVSVLGNWSVMSVS